MKEGERCSEETKWNLWNKMKKIYEEDILREMRRNENSLKISKKKKKKRREEEREKEKMKSRKWKNIEEEIWEERIECQWREI